MAFITQMSFAQKAGDIVSVEQKLNLTPEGIASLMFNGDSSGVTQDIISFLTANSSGLVAYKLTYYTPDYSGNLVKATGLVMYPKVNFRLSTVLYCHPTTDTRNNVPSNLRDTAGFGFVLPLSYALSGYIVAAPDYLGMGTGDGKHPYVNAKTEASASIDFMKAANAFLTSKSVKRYDENFITGYSQGGHAVMSVMKANKEKYGNLYDFEYAYPGAGPYDLSVTTFEKGIMAQNSYPNSAFLANVINSCQMLGYKQYQNSYTEIISPAYQQKYQQNVINETGGLTWGPTVWREMFTPAFINAVTNNANHPLRQCLKDSDVYNWNNKTATTMGFASLDKTINPANAGKAKDIQRGYYSWWDLAKYDIDVADLGGFDHGTGAVTWLFASIYKFNTIRSGGFFNEWAWLTGKNATQTNENFQLSYSKVDPVLSISSQALKGSEVSIKKLNAEFSRPVQNSQTELKNLEKGVYLIKVKNNSGEEKMFPFVKDNPTLITENELIKDKTSDNITINLNGLKEVQEVNVFDQNLNRVLTAKPNEGDSDVKMEVSKLAAGDYTVEVATKNTSISAKTSLGAIPTAGAKVTATVANNELKISAPQEISAVQVYDAAGKLVSNFSGRQQKVISSALIAPQGVYLVKITLTNNQTQVVKVIK